MDRMNVIACVAHLDSIPLALFQVKGRTVQPIVRNPMSSPFTRPIPFVILDMPQFNAI
jgi:hypothetical protein